MKKIVSSNLRLESILGMLQNCVMNNVHDSISLIEKYLDINNTEYQSYGNLIEVYPLENDLIRIKLNENKIEIISQVKEYNYDKLDDNFFTDLQGLIA